MNSSKQIIHYLEALAGKLTVLGAKTPYHLLVSGGAWMLLAGERRTTDDIDFALIASPHRPKPGKVIGVSIQHGGEIATRAGGTVFAQAVEEVAAEFGLPLDWMNDESAGYLYDSAPGADAYLWRSFGLLHIYLPTAEYVFTLKLMASRRKDQPDIKVLMKQLKLRTPEEAQAILDRFLAASEQQFYEVEKKLKRHFR